MGVYLLQKSSGGSGSGGGNGNSSLSPSSVVSTELELCIGSFSKNNNKNPTLYAEDQEYCNGLDLSLSLAPPGTRKPQHDQETHHQQVPIPALPLNIQHHHHQEVLLDMHHQEVEAIAAVPLNVVYHQQEVAAIAAVPLNVVYHQREVAVDDDDDDDGMFSITKKLEKSDVGHLSRLLLRKKAVEEHVVPLLNEREREEVRSQGGLRVAMRDMDTMTEHGLVLKLLNSSRSYVLINKWREAFVRRRGLVRGDTIGIYWDVQHSCFYFSLLRRAPPDNPLALALLPFAVN